jgi:G:T/U-mismatch repair DNA glycosylase
LEKKHADEIHPFEPFFTDNTKYLIIGSFPPIKLTNKNIQNENTKHIYDNYLKYNSFKSELDIRFYYGSSDNYFWCLLRIIYNLPLINDEEIKNKMGIKGIGFTDLFQKCNRKIINDKIYSSDNNLIVVEERNIDDTLCACKNIDTLYFTSKWVYKKYINKYQNNINKIILESPSGSYDRSIGRITEYKIKKQQNKDYNTFAYRLDKYKDVLPK